MIKEEENEKREEKMMTGKGEEKKENKYDIRRDR